MTDAGSERSTDDDEEESSGWFDIVLDVVLESLGFF
ncbi:hypothetical protein SAMN05444422_102249 [Halobiforma haloterrestris]|uniref:Uncharacterized protein n=1 Tax=Natronobacterium haloterrestre TaxID=148448 RepID=A0A1I1E7Y9_NATHA|nr:hypothetical protein SAMN05444422_102249 [Halobiforma haloterrestris]